MRNVNFYAIATAAVASFVASSLWYGLLFGGLWMSLSGVHSTAVTPAEIIAQFVRDFVVAAVLAWVLALVGARSFGRAIGLSLGLWFGFEAMAIAGSVIHEHYPIGLYLIHCGDALLKTVLATAIVVAWPRRRAASVSEGV